MKSYYYKKAHTVLKHRWKSKNDYNQGGTLKLCQYYYTQKQIKIKKLKLNHKNFF